MDWGYKAMLTATTVALLLTVAQLSGRRVAGVLAGLPTVTGPALLWLALENGASYAVEAAIGSVVGCALSALLAARLRCGLPADAGEHALARPARGAGHSAGMNIHEMTPLPAGQATANLARDLLSFRPR